MGSMNLTRTTYFVADSQQTAILQYPEINQ